MTAEKRVHWCHHARDVLALHARRAAARLIAGGGAGSGEARAATSRSRSSDDGDGDGAATATATTDAMDVDDDDETENATSSDDDDVAVDAVDDDADVDYAANPYGDVERIGASIDPGTGVVTGGFDAGYFVRCEIGGERFRGMLFSPVLTTQRRRGSGGDGRDGSTLVLPSYCYPGSLGFDGSIDAVGFTNDAGAAGAAPETWRVTPDGANVPPSAVYAAAPAARGTRGEKKAAPEAPEANGGGGGGGGGERARRTESEAAVQAALAKALRDDVDAKRRRETPVNVDLDLDLDIDDVPIGKLGEVTAAAAAAAKPRGRGRPKGATNREKNPGKSTPAPTGAPE
jgi:hypothetical protein